MEVSSQHLRKIPFIRRLPNPGLGRQIASDPEPAQGSVRAWLPLVAVIGLLLGLSWTLPSQRPLEPSESRIATPIPLRPERTIIQGPMADGAVVCAVDGERCRVLLRPETVGNQTLGHGRQYGLLIASLGEYQSSFQVQISREATAETEGWPAIDRVLARLPVDDPHRLPLAAVPRINSESGVWLRQNLVRNVGFRRPVARDIATSKPTAATADEIKNVQRSFYLHVTDGPLSDPKQYTRVDAQHLLSGQYVEVLLDKQHPTSPQLRQLADDIVHFLEQDIGPRLAATLGQCQDVDGNGKFTILLTPWLERLQGGRTQLQGFARSSDFLERSPRPFSNRCDMIYLNATLTTGPHVRSLLAHEMAHAICFSERKSDRPGAQPFAPEEDWLNEAIAHLAENTCSNDWSNLDHRIDAYLQDPARYPLVVADYYRAGLWRDPGCRGATYLFLRWCVDQYGPDLLRRLVRSRFNGKRSLEWATGVTFPELFRQWAVAVAAETCNSSKPNCQHPYRSLSLRERIGNQQLTGPAMTDWDPRRGPLQQELRGTSFCIVRIAENAQSRPDIITVEAQSGTQLQVTLIRLPPRDGQPSFEQP